MKYKEREEIVDSLEKLLDYMKTDRALELPAFRMEISKNVYWAYPNTRLSQKELLVRVAKAFPRVSKNHDGNYFTLIAEFGKACTFAFWSNREAVCRKVITGTRQVPVTKTVQVEGEYNVVEDVEWVCDDPLLAAS